VGAKCIYIDNKAGSYNPSVSEYVHGMELYMKNYRSNNNHHNHCSGSCSSSSNEVIDNENMVEHENIPVIRAVIVCHTYGVPAEIEEIALFCRRHNFILIEDISECVGVSIKVKKAPTTTNGFIQHHHDDDSHSEIESSSSSNTSSLGDESVLLGREQHQQSTSS